jgi:hypothetical protein
MLGMQTTPLSMKGGSTDDGRRSVRAPHHRRRIHAAASEATIAAGTEEPGGRRRHHPAPHHPPQVSIAKGGRSMNPITVLMLSETVEAERRREIERRRHRFVEPEPIGDEPRGRSWRLHLPRLNPVNSKA